VSRTISEQELLRLRHEEMVRDKEVTVRRAWNHSDTYRHNDAGAWELVGWERDSGGGVASTYLPRLVPDKEEA